MAEQAEKSPETFIRTFAEPLIIDEVQYAPSLFRNLKAKIDLNKRPGRFILTGSQSFALMPGISESLGRPLRGFKHAEPLRAGAAGQRPGLR